MLHASSILSVLYRWNYLHTSIICCHTFGRDGHMLCFTVPWHFCRIYCCFFINSTVGIMAHRSLMISKRRPHAAITIDAMARHHSLYLLRDISGQGMSTPCHCHNLPRDASSRFFFLKNFLVHSIIEIPELKT